MDRSGSEVLIRVGLLIVLVLTFLLLVAATVIGEGGIGQWVETVSTWIEILALASIGAILAIRRARNAVGWLLLSYGFFYALNLFGEALAVYSSVELDRPLWFSQNIMASAGRVSVLLSP